MPLFSLESVFEASLACRAAQSNGYSEVNRHKIKVQSVSTNQDQAQFVTTHTNSAYEHTAAATVPTKVTVKTSPAAIKVRGATSPHASSANKQQNGKENGRISGNPVVVGQAWESKETFPIANDAEC